MTREEYTEYINNCKSNLTEKQRISLAKEYNKLPKSWKYWNKRLNNIIVCSEAEYIFMKYCEKRISYINQRIEDLEYILDIPEEHTFMYKLFNC